MADKVFKGEEKGRFPGLLLLGVAMGVAVLVVAALTLGEFAIPVAILIAVCVAVALAYRGIAGANRGASSDADSSDNVPKQAARGDRPLGDTPEAHDELNVHDLPLDNPGRHEAEVMAGDEDATTRGMAEGGGAGGTDRFKRGGEGTSEVSAEEAREGAEPGR
jgi:hypothetical protein